MKKLLTSMLFVSVASVSFATTTPTTSATVASSVKSMPAFDNTKMKCGEHTLGQKENTDSLTSMCKGFAFGKGKAGFLDEHSGKKVVCQEKKGILEINTCQVSPKQ